MTILEDVSGRVPSEPGSREPDPQAVPALSGFDPSRKHYRSEEYAMCTIDTGRDSDGAPLSEVWTFAGEDDYVEGHGWLEVRVHEIVETERSGALAVYYRQWFAPDGEPAWGKKPLRKVGALASLKSLIRRRKMRPCDSGSRSQSHDPQGHGPEAGRAAVEDRIAQTKAVP